MSFITGTKDVDVDGLVDGVRHLAEMARAAEEGWRPAVTLDIDGETPMDKVPDDDRQVIVFLNGHVAITDHDGRKGGGWGIRLGYFDHEKGYWRVFGQREMFVTHWRELPPSPAPGKWPPLESEVVRR